MASRKTTFPTWAAQDDRCMIWACDFEPRSSSWMPGFGLVKGPCSLVPGPCFCPLVYPVVDGFVPEAGVLGLQDPVAFVGEVEHFAGDVEELEGVEKLVSFADVEAIVELAVDD